MVLLSTDIKSAGLGGSGTVEILKIPPSVQKLFSFEVEPCFAQQSAHLGVCLLQVTQAWLEANLSPEKPSFWAKMSGERGNLTPKSCLYTKRLLLVPWTPSCPL